MKENNLSVQELLLEQEYKTPIWNTIFISKANLIIKLILALFFSFIMDLFDVMENNNYLISYIFIELLHYNYFNEEKYKP
jgi:hypothetical protein